ncbi:MAG: TIGR03986 family CRISPR-associated RAMP protein [Desulfobulbaceae bacterium]|nr:TIGR03986 family CRISPR-associated RAMP protein [Desulfobulbaceae bacterium]
MTLERGKLVISKKGKPQVEIEGKFFNPSQGELSQTILERLIQLNGAEVEFEREGGQPKKIREAGSTFVSPRAGAIRTNDPRQMGRSRETQEQAHGGGTDRASDFHNPYNFVPAPPRITDDSELGDHAPVFQDRFYPDRINGRIRIVMEAITPLLVPDPNNCREVGNGHKIFELLKGKDHKPLIPSSSIRGMLRTAYEAVTNSRLGRFPQKDHGKRLAYRMETGEGTRLIPARIDNGKIHLLTGTATVGRNGVPDGPQYAAWLPRYNGNDKATNKAKKYPDNSLPQHGDEVECMMELIQHHHPDFQYWRVGAIVKAGSPLPNIALTGMTQQIRGWVCITNANISRKHDERVFFSLSSSASTISFPITDSHRKMWQELIENYQEIHKDDLKKRDNNNQAANQYLGSKPGRTAWSRHVYTKADCELRDGTLCYVRLAQNRSDVEDLFPVMIARKLFSSSPWDLLHASLRPASKISELSPADRVFGWVLTDSSEDHAQSKVQTAVRGLLRVGPVRCESSVEDSIDVFSGKGLPLAILAAPKPQQGRFYVAKSQNGDAQDDGLSKVDAGYYSDKGLRGRKVYPHHMTLPESHWKKPLEDRTQALQGPWQEYRRPKLSGEEQQDDQNRSILGWVKPGCRFVFDIHVTNLSKVELGALLYLLRLPENHFHRFGGGKPLGFGSVRLSVADCELTTGDTLRERYCSWISESNRNNISDDTVAVFKDAVRRAYVQNHQGSFEQISFVKAFLHACKGFDDRLPIHYPRATDSGNPGPPNPKGESFKWFVANDQKRAPNYALGDLAMDIGLPTLQDPQTQTH